MSVKETTSQLSWDNRLDHFLTRWGYRRGSHRVEPGLYALGNPTPDSPVFVTANYSLSFDALRSALPGVDGYILVLDTKGVNVWCAAGKGTFGTDELVHRVEITGLHEVVTHRTLILPQLGATGVAAHLVKKATKFRVEFGPVRAEDLPAYLKTREATPEMRRVRFNLWDRLVLVPIEVTHSFIPTLVVATLLYFFAGWVDALAVVTAVFTGAVLFPVLLPWMPTKVFTLDGFLLGALAALPFSAAAIFGDPSSPIWTRVLWALAYLLFMAPVTAYLSLNFTGSTTYTSKSQVEREMKRYMRWMIGLFGAGVVLLLGLIVYGFL